MKRSEFASTVFKHVGGHVTAPRVTVGVAWAAIEGSKAQNNPWDTTEPYEGATDFNSAGVKNYLTIEDGIEATIKTLENGNYAHILKVLRTPEASFNDLRNAINGSPWGSTISFELYRDVEERYSMYDEEIVGSGTEPGIAEAEPHVETAPESETSETETTESSDNEDASTTESPKSEDTTNTTVDDTETPPSESEAAPVEESHTEMTKELPLLSVGSHSRAVMFCSVFLAWTDPTKTFTPRSMFDSTMETVVKAYQKLNGLTESGVIDSDTWSSFLA